MVQLCYFAKEVSTIDAFVYHYNTNNSDSYTHQARSDRRLLLLEQGLNNYLGIRSFLSQKEEVLFQGTTQYVVGVLNQLIQPLIETQKERLLSKDDQNRW